MFSVIYAHSFSTGLGLHRFRFRFSHSSPQGANGRHQMCIRDRVKISTVLSYQGGKQQAQPSTYAKLSDVPSDALLEMREQNPEEYKRCLLYTS